MADAVVTVRDAFDLPHPGSPAESSPRWQTLRQWISEELQGMRTSAFDDVGARVGELLEMAVTDIFVESWKGTDAIKGLLEESRKAPNSVTSVELGNHSIKSQHRPHIEVRARNGSPKKIEFTLRLVFHLKEFSLRIQNGSIKEIETGPCEMQGALEYQGLAVAEKKKTALDLPGTVNLEGAKKAEVKVPTTQQSSAIAEQTPEKMTVPLEPPKWEAPAKIQSLPAAESPKLDQPGELKTAVSGTVPEPMVTEAISDNEPAETEEEEREVFVL